MATKTCSKCGETKELSEFSRDKSCKDGLQRRCRACQAAWYLDNRKKVSESRRAYYEANKEAYAERARRNREDNKEAYAERDREYAESNRERISERKRLYYLDNRDEILDRCREYRLRNRGECAERQRSYRRARYQGDPAYAMVARLRSRLRDALNGKAKPTSTMELVGCSAEKLCAWIEMHFAEGMTWENRGKWHIDHIRPVASFEDPADPACWHWSNLQPLWAEDNLRKGDSFDGE